MAAGGGIKVGTGVVDIELKFPELGKAAQGVGAALDKASRGAGKGLSDALKGSAPAIRAMGGAFDQSARGLGKGMADAFRGSAPAIKSVGSALNQSAKGFGSGLSSASRGVGSALFQTTRGVGAGLGQAAKGFGTGLGAAMRGTGSAINSIGTGLGRAARGLGAGINSTLRGVSSLLSTALSPLKMLTGGFGGGGLMALLGGGAAVGGALGGAGLVAKQAMDMEDRMVRLGRVTGLEGEKLKSLGDQFREMATTMPGTNLEKLFGIGTAGAKLGIQGPALAMFTRDVAKMSAVMEDIPVDELTERMTGLLNLFHRGPSDALGLASALNALDMQSIASARDIMQTSTSMSGMASTLKGITLPQILALATAMRDAKIEPGTGGTAMSQLLQGFTGRREAGLAKLTGLDKSTFRNMVDTKPFEALKAVFGALNQMDPRARTKALEELHFTGQKTSGTFSQLMQTFERVAKYEGVATAQFASGASITEGYGKTAGRARAQLDLLWNSVETVGAKLGEGLLPIIKGASKGLTDLATDVGAFLKANEGSIAAWGDRVGEALTYVGLAWRKFPLFVDYALGYATEKWEQFIEVASRFGSKLSDNFGWAMRSLRKIIENTTPGLVNFLGDLGGQIGKNFIEQMKFNIHIGAPTLAGWLGIKKSDVKPVVPNFALLNDPLKEIKAAPGFGGMFKGLPNRAEELAILEGDIRDARKEMDRELAARRAMANGMEDAARRQARVHDLMGRVLGEREAARAAPVGMGERLRQARANMNRMLGGPAAAAAAGRRRARNLAIQARKAKAKAAVPADVAAAQAIGDAVGAALKDNAVGQEILKLMRVMVRDGVGAVFGAP
jgi:TP901 family phage tail tape measure protein